MSSVKRISSYSLSEKLKSRAIRRKYLDASQSYVISHLHNVHRHLASLLRAQIKKLDWTKEDGSALLSEEVVACSPIFFLRLRALSRSYLNFQDPTNEQLARASG